MPYRAHTIGQSVFLKPPSSSTEADVEEMLRLVNAAADGGARRWLVLLIPESGNAPAGKVRDRLVAELGGLSARFEHVGYVIEGEGLATETRRLFTRALVMLSGSKAQVATSLAELLGPAEAQAVLPELRAQGFIR